MNSKEEQKLREFVRTMSRLASINADNQRKISDALKRVAALECAFRERGTHNKCEKCGRSSLDLVLSHADGRSLYLCQPCLFNTQKGNQP
jgi:hypothetical protein